ncbi:hypothetical protein LSAT2_023548 [Lamellibrachia satsuma]|nr:hypothetical protein LSAT2_023548 [Lamellibrachia satsuma]
MPGKKKSKGKKGGKSKGGGGGGAPKGGYADPFAYSDEIPPPPRPGESLIKLLTTHPVGERDLYGMKISTRALDNLTPQEISDLKIVFEAFDYRNHGYIGAVDVRRAMRALGFQVSKEQARQMVEETGLKGEG